MISIMMKLFNIEFLRIFLLVKHLPFAKQYMAALLPLSLVFACRFPYYSNFVVLWYVFTTA